ncbi:glycosyltransferase family 4 protein [Altererythrobacter lutimaris]|uniref:Glycosyltransferase family 4 protein n=1 Tax=Altererythrobacter lutimaris TaxID=2743979 RepID=A0A850H697_9SPHN|nr:glycosyltransferase family 4 protein [Altererythrobacter lutimaris]NVE93343.1 glycosyltransferase family 4 protein [Altererythrobacter lutimaris]
MAALPADMAAANVPNSAGSEARPVALLVSKQRIVASNNGSSAYVLALARSIRDSGFDVWLIQPSADLPGRTPVLRFSDELNVFARHEILGMERIGGAAVSLSPAVWSGFVTGGLKLVLRKLFGDKAFLKDRPRPYSIALPWQRQEHQFVEHFAQQACDRLKLVVSDYVFATDAFANVPVGTAKAVIMHDLFSQRDGKGADSVAVLSEDAEVAMLSRADMVITIQSEERDFVAKACPEADAVLAAMPASIVTEPQPGYDNRLLFIGSDTAPNSVGLNWFCEEVWPIVLASKPQARLYVIGTVGRKFDTASYPNVSFLGLVDDLASHYADAGVLISPLTFGSGLKIKLVEALGQGKAVVATSVTLQGVEDICRDVVHSHDDPQAMAEAIIALVEDREARAELAGKALACAQAHFSAESVHAELKAKLAAISAR